MPPAIEALARDFQRDALRIQTAGEARQHGDIEYRAFSVTTRDRENAIFNTLRYYEAPSAIIFCKTRANVNHLLARMGNRGKREFIQVLRLMEALPREVVSLAVGEAIRLGAIGFDAVKLIALARLERRPARLDLAAYPHLPKTSVKTTSAADYAVLLPGAAA